MCKISVIIPVYNTEKYISKCLESILNQKFSDYEIIVVNDGSTDNSEKIIKDFIKKYPEKFKYYIKENGGLSDARNYGVERANGEYICFIDSDDYISQDLFDNLKNNINNGYDLIKYKCIKVDNNNNEIEKINGPVFENETGTNAFNILYSQDVYLDIAWLYLYRRKFFCDNNFRFPIKKFHEDFAIIPYILISANSVCSTNIFGYYYVQTDNSITRTNNIQKVIQRTNDMLEHYDNLSKEIKKLNIDKQTKENFLIYITNNIILGTNEIPKKYQKEYIKQIQKRKMIKNIKVRNLKQLLKKMILNLSVKLYLKIR